MGAIVNLPVILGLICAACTIFLLKGWWRGVVLIGTALVYVMTWIVMPDFHLSAAGRSSWILAEIGFVLGSIIPPTVLVCWIYSLEFYPYGLLRPRRIKDKDGNWV